MRNTGSGIRNFGSQSSMTHRFQENDISKSLPRKRESGEASKDWIRRITCGADLTVKRFDTLRPALRHDVKVLLILCMIPLMACGYQMVGKETHIPPGLNSVAVPTFKNRTYEPGIEVPFTQAFLNEFILDRRVNVVNRAQADSLLEGIIKDFNIYSVSYDRSGYVLEYQTNVILDLTLKDRTGKVLWEEKNFSETQWYRASSNILTNEANKAAAIQSIGRLVAGRLRNRFFQNF
jgi:outer membrane lipopolysaccharide assembly protein LptE/RlpB